MGTTIVDTLKPTTWETSPAVYYTSSGVTPALGVNSFPFPTNFFWDGTSNILIEICANGGSSFFNNQTANPTVAWTTGLPFKASHTYGANDISNFCSISTTTETGNATTRPNITFSWLTAPPDCSGVPNAGTVSSTKNPACPNDKFFLSATYPAAIGLTYQWQYSTDNLTWNNIAGATKDTVTTSLVNDTYYRLMITCTSSGKSASSTALLVTRMPGVSGTFEINNSLVTPGPNQFKTFNDAYNYIKCGISGPVVFNVVNTGTPYNEQLLMSTIFGASASNTVVFNGNGATINYLSSSNANAAVIKLNGVHHMIIDSLNITALGNTSSQYGFGVHLLNDADSNTISRCNITVDAAQTGSNNYSGIVVSGGNSPTSYGSYCDSNTFVRNTIKGGIYGICLQGGTTSFTDYPINRNQVLNNNIQDFYTAGVYMNNNLMTRVEGNEMTRPLRANSNTTCYGVYLTGANVGNLVSKNRIHSIFIANPTFNGSFYGVYFSNAVASAGLENVVANNMVYDIRCLGTLYGMANSGSSYANYYYNTVVFDDANSISTNPTYGFYATFLTSFVDIKNNLFSIARGGTGLKYGMCLADSRLSLFTINYNNYFSNGHPTYSVGYYFTTAVTKLSDWQALTKYDTTSVSIDPGFKNLTTGDLTPTSAALGDKGTPVATLDDINKTTRSVTKPDIGAVEYTLPGCTTAFLPGDAFSNVGYATCTGKSVLLNLKNNDVGLGLTYQWQTATDVAGTWSNLSTALVSPPYNFNAGNNTVYYRAAVACNGGTPQYTVPIQITIGGYFPAGTYTIDQSRVTDPVGTKNFNSFKDAASAISCGIAGPVVFNAKPGVYNEHIRIAAIANSSSVNTVTFQSESGTAAGTELTFGSPDVNNNYTVQLDSASNVSFKNLTVSATGVLYARAIDILNTASNDSILNCVINSVLPDATYYSTFGSDQTTTAGVFAGTNYTGGNLVIKGNTFHKGSKGVYISGYSTTVPVSAIVFSRNNVVQANTFDSIYHQNIYAANASSIKIIGNNIPVKTAYTTTSFGQGVSGIYMNNCDSAILVAGNNITIGNNTGYSYGIYMANNNGTATGRGKIMNNKIYGLTGLTYLAVGMYNSAASYADVVNNEISVSSSVAGTSNSVYCSAITTSNAMFTNYYNNTLLNTSPNPGIYNVALWVDHQSYSTGGGTNVFNNVMVNRGGGPAMFINYTAEHLKMDYNLLYTSGTILVKKGPTGGTFNADYADLASWRKAYYQEFNSIVYNPGLTSTTNLAPLASDPNSWALQGRGTQIAGNNSDINGNARPVLLTDGVPDLGAYEFDPTVAPPDMVATPATPAPGITQKFSMGTDTVTTITWAAGSTVPTAISLKRYTGRIPAGFDPTQKSMYYYVAANVTGAGPFKYKVQQYFLQPWMRNLPNESTIKTGQTDATNNWVVSGASLVDTLNNFYTDSVLTFIDKFTGMTDGKMPTPPAYVTTNDSLNTGTRFWVPYAPARDMYQSNAQQFKLALASAVATQVTVSVRGTAYSKTYSIPAGGVVTTDEIPKFGAYDGRLMGEGLFDRTILVEANNPISAALSGEGSISTNALLMPTGTYAKDFTTLSVAQFSGYPPTNGTMGTSWVNVVSDNDNTVVQITPSGATTGGRAAGVPFQVTLNRGQVYQIMGAYIGTHTKAETGGLNDTYESYDLTGTKVVSIPNSDGKCMPVAVFSGSSGTGVSCTEAQGGADKYMFQQSYPMQAWGKKFLTAPLATRNSKNQMLYNLYRVMVKDPTTVVKRNGVVMTGLRANTFYQFSTRDPQYITADKPIMVSQCMTYFTSCGNDEYSNPGSNETVSYLTPVGLGVKSATFYRKLNDRTYITVIVPTAALSSLIIDGNKTFDSTYVHPQNAAYTVVMKSWASSNGVAAITCDSNFTANVHQPYNISGYLYNVGFQVPRIDPKSFIDNKYDIVDGHNLYACTNSKFKASLYVPMKAKSLTWKLSSVPGLGSMADVTVNNPVPTDSMEINSQDYYVYPLNQELTFSQTGTDTIPVSITYFASNPASCDLTATGNVIVVVKQGPSANFTVVYDNCIQTTAQFTAAGTVSNGAAFDRWNWNFGDNTTANVQNPTKKWNQTGTFNVGLLAIANDGCYDSTNQKIVVNSCDNIFIPNSFTPNGDGHNDQFKMYANNVREMKMMIFNQWGQKIFETTSMANGWDGTSGGKPQPSGVYMYVCRIILNSGDIVDKKGSINLVR
jgi:gliding motility-associated-like protein